MWKTFFNNRELLSQSYFALISFTFISYLFFISQLLKHQIKNFKLILILFITLIGPLIISNNALSYDAFNYIFNAKMVSVYGADPHTQVALDFPDDPWIKFMHNTHTSAPYGRAWTLLSLIPFSFGFGKFLSTWLVFRLFSLLPLMAFLMILWICKKKINHNWAIFLIFNPLNLIEIISNFHNDFWMITPAVLSLLILDSKSKKKTTFIIKALLSLLLLGISIWIKLATVILIPIWLMILFKSRLNLIPRFSQITRNWPLLASVGMFIPLLTLRSQQFHPWYLVWTIAFIPFFLKNKLSKIWAVALLVLSMSSMYRYLPFLYHNNYDGNVLLWQKVISFTPFVIVLILSLKNLFAKSK
ncbi:MAG: hypothetical protein GW941_01470 [Candidatus Pacebacteria bacterium]|nr:hypothetical protein [Candidatus Paceibacterota bacterium]